MKNCILFSISFFMFILMSSCGSVKDGATEAEDKAPRTYLNLADYLKTKGGVIVSGTGDNIVVQIRGINSIKGDTRPFFYVDGIPMGRRYAAANNALNPNNIKSVRILSGLSELAIYGEDGNSGVILIKSKKN